VPQPSIRLSGVVPLVKAADGDRRKKNVEELMPHEHFCLLSACRVKVTEEDLAIFWYTAGRRRRGAASR